MKAAVCRAFNAPLVIEDLEIDPPQAGEVTVQIAACAICHSDIHYIAGAWGGDLPAVYGHEAAGLVTALGPGVTRVAVGDPVIVSLLRACGMCFYCVRAAPHLCEASFALDRESRLRDRTGAPVAQGLRTGAFAEQVVVDQSQVVPVPATMPLDSAALLACGVITGFGAVVHTARVPPGSSVVVIGTGGVGLNSLQGAALCGADPVIAIDPAPDKRAVARRFGATHAIDPNAEDVPAAVAALTRGRGADYVLVTVGNAPAIERSFALLRRGGTLVVVGMPALGVKASFEVAEFAAAAQHIVGSRMGSTHLETGIPNLVALYEQGRLKLD
ncbi:MAG: zinc-binding dehydrogenase, partial [Alphaproteobacteria bacterium]